MVKNPKRSAAAAAKYPISAGVKRLRSARGQQTAVLLGAGASAAFDIPLTSELLPLIVKWLDNKKFLAAIRDDDKSVGKTNRDLLYAYLMQLLPGESLTRNNLPLVTSLLSLLDFSLATGQSLMPGRSVNDTRQARSLLERGILEAIADDEDFSAKSWRKFERFCGVLSDLKKDAPSKTLTLLTTNYDMAADIAAYECAGVRYDDNWNLKDIAAKIDFGFRWQDPSHSAARMFERPVSPSVTLLKLHGSTNWLRCPLCDNTYLNPWGPIWKQAYRTKCVTDNTCHCSENTRLQTQIISPSYVREMREPNMHGIWKAALDSLRTAQRWLIIGYSFPDEDLAVRALFTRAYASRPQRPKIVVVQNTDASINRYEAFFDRNDLTFCAGGLDALLDTWRKVRT